MNTGNYLLTQFKGTLVTYIHDKNVNIFIIVHSKIYFTPSQQIFNYISLFSVNNALTKEP